MKTRTNQPVFLDNGNPVDDSALGGTKLFKHTIIDSDIGEQFVVISTSSTSLVGASTADILLNQSTLKMLYGQSLIIATEGSGVDSMYYYASGSVSSISVALVETDTISPL